MEGSRESKKSDANKYEELKQKLLRREVVIALKEHDPTLVLEDLVDNRELQNIIVGPVVFNLINIFGLEYDSLELLEAFSPDEDTPGGEGNTGVREPRTPIKPSNYGSIALGTENI